MKRLYAIVAMMLCLAGMASAQKAQEPDFEFEPFLFNVEDSTLGEPIPCENAYSKAKAAASMYIVGIGKAKAYYYVNGIASPMKLDRNATLVINTGGKSPMQVLSINRFEVLKKKRRFQTGEIGTFTGAESGNDEAAQHFRYKKLGKGSVIIPLNTLDAGEYCLSITNSNTNSKSTKVYTFSIK